MNRYAALAANLTQVAEHHERRAANARKLALLNWQRAQETGAPNNGK